MSDPEFGYYYPYFAELLKKVKKKDGQRELEAKIAELEEQERDKTPAPEDDNE